jgi:hypothetical protein
MFFKTVNERAGKALLDKREVQKTTIPSAQKSAATHFEQNSF